MIEMTNVDAVIDTVICAAMAPLSIIILAMLDDWRKSIHLPALSGNRCLGANKRR